MFGDLMFQSITDGKVEELVRELATCLYHPRMTVNEIKDIRNVPDDRELGAGD